MARVLLVYPNTSGIRRIPLGLSCVASELIDSGHDASLFDTTFYVEGDTDNEKREELGIVKKVTMSNLYRCHSSSDPVEDFHETITRFKPDLIGITLLQDNYHFTKKLLHDIKKYTDAFVVAGGVMPSVAPDFVLSTLDVDGIMIGESEKAFNTLASGLDHNKSKKFLSNVPNLMFKTSDHGFIKNAISPLHEINRPCYSIFDEEHLWRPFIGKSWKTGYVELTRGCPFKCSFCANPVMNSLYGNKRLRSKPVHKFIEEVAELRDTYGLTLFSFCDENFLSLNKHDLKLFSEEWSNKIGLPFMIQTGIETITEQRLEWIKEAGCATVSVGIECGNEVFRREILNKHYSNDAVIKAFSLLKKAGIRSTANNMLGFPRETEKHIKETVDLNIKASPDSVSLAIFSPYIGCSLHKMCVEDGLIGEWEVPEHVLTYDPGLRLPEEHKKMLKYYLDNFQELVFPTGKIN